MARPKEEIDVEDVLGYVKGADYPASRLELIHQAEDNDAPDSVIAILQTLPDREYGNAGDVEKMLGRGT